jgi:serine/threonine-protein kinase
MLTNVDDDEQRRIMLTDFGIARELDDASGLTQTNMTLGTVAYAAPEQLMGEDVDGRADQYALAATAYHLLTGSPMFGSSNPAVVIGRHLNAPPPRLTDSRPELFALDPVLEKSLSKNPDDRFRTCTDFANALGRAMSSAPSRPPAAAPPAPPSPPLQVREHGTAILPAGYPPGVVVRPVNVAATASRWPWALAAVALALIVGAIVFAVWPRNQQSSPSQATSIAPTAVTSSRTSSSTSSAVTTTALSSTSLANAITFDAMRDLVTDFYGELPGNALGAWNKLDNHYQQRAGEADYLNFWSSIESVSLISVTPRDATSVTARLRYVLRDGRIDTEDRWLSVVPANDQLLIYDSERIGPA